MVTGPISNKTNAEPIQAGRTDKAGVRTKKDAEKAEDRGSVLPTDTYQVNLSDSGISRAADIKKAQELAHQAPDVREELVQKYKAMLAQGTYKADAGNIADGLLREAIKDELSTGL